MKAHERAMHGQALGGIPLNFGIAIEDEPSGLSCIRKQYGHIKEFQEWLIHSLVTSLVLFHVFVYESTIICLK